MVLEIVVALFVGILAGTLTGLFPGIHINLVAAGLLALFVPGVYFSGIQGIVLIVFVVAMAVTHTFIDFIPSVFLGAPEEDSFLSVLPGHQLLREGRGYEAIVLTLYGSLMALPVVLIFSLLFVYFLPSVFDFSRALIPYVLIFASFYLIFREEEIVNSLVVFVFAGFLGLFAFNLPVKEPLLPLLTGLFGVSGLIVSLKSNLKFPRQKVKTIKDIKLGKQGVIRSTFAAALVAPLSSFLPGMGAGHAAVLGSEVMGEKGKDKRSFLFLVGAINTIVMALSFVTIYAIGRTRTGAAVAVEKILGEISFGNLFLILGVVIISGLLAFFVGVNLSKVFARNFGRVSYRKISVVVLVTLLIINLVLSNPLGLVVLISASALGVFAILSKARRINLMGALLIPTIIFYLAL